MVGSAFEGSVSAFQLFDFAVGAKGGVDNANAFSETLGPIGGQSPGAAGGFVLYPSKPNFNSLQAVYAK